MKNFSSVQAARDTSTVMDITVTSVHLSLLSGGKKWRSKGSNVQASGQTVGYRDHDDVLVCMRSYAREFLPIADASFMPAIESMKTSR
ncbi:hypothetical protein Baya_12216 [Bagarius yarrelli]|uniref:Uncharacterized protein n=1 Tax=Bagarius yarrelli TaxID=175774 RepID=A0A556V2B0_BAGYA|nr:hypothetical protein Baya_12216 [Bagarius yarrelli]